MDRKTSQIKFVGLHAHSVFSVFDAFGYPQDHMNFAYENGCDALALTDHGNMNGFSYQYLHSLKMSEESKSFKPIYGCEFYFVPSLAEWRKLYEESKTKKKDTDEENTGIILEDEADTKKKNKNPINRRSHLVLLTQNQVGLYNLFRLVSESYKADNFYRYPRIDFELLSKYSEGLIASSACLGGFFGRIMFDNYERTDEVIYSLLKEASEKMQLIFKDKWFGELQWHASPEQHRLNHLLIRLSKDTGLKLITTCDSHYPDPELWLEREIYKRLGWLSKKKDSETKLPESVEELGVELYPKNGDQVFAAFKKYSVGECYDDSIVLESIERTWEIAFKLIEEFKPDTAIKLPSFVVPENELADKKLRELCDIGLRVKKLENNPIYLKRLSYELDIIESRDFAKYMLTVYAIMKRARERMICGSGRGSSSGSLICYLLNITTIDPIKWNLQFERFITKDGAGLPDVDMDVSKPAEFKQQLIGEWGIDNVVLISNFNTLKPRSLIKDICRLLGNIPFEEVNLVTSKMLFEATPKAKEEHDIKSGAYEPTYEELVKYSETLQKFLQKYPLVAKFVKNIVGQIKSLSLHAGGVLISDDLNQKMPLIASGGARQTPWCEGQNVRHLEPLGFVKQDILGISSLVMIEDCIRHILKQQGIKEPTFDEIQSWYNANLHPEVLDFKDQTVYKNVFHKGNFFQTFQFSERPVQQYCKACKPSSIEELANITALFRPGPLAAGFHTMYQERIRDKSKVSYIHPSLKEVLANNLGLVIYQEDISALANKLGKNISLDEGNTLRKLIIKRGIGNTELKKRKIYEKLIAGCIEKGMTQQQADKLVELLELFGQYSFSKNHCLPYIFLSYQCAWLWSHYPASWACAAMNKDLDEPEKTLMKAKNYGFNIIPLDINKSDVAWEIDTDGKSLIQPLMSIKGLGESAIRQIIDNRPFKTIEELLFNDNISYGKLNKKALDVLIRSQAMNNMVDSRFANLKHFWSVVVSKPKSLKQFNELVDCFKGEADFTDEEKLVYLTNLTGRYPIEMVLSDKLIADLKKLKVPPVGEFDTELGICYLIVREKLEKKTKNNKPYWILKTADDHFNSVDVKCWGIVPGRDRLRLNTVYLAKLDYDKTWGLSCRCVGKCFKELS